MLIALLQRKLGVPSALVGPRAESTSRSARRATDARAARALARHRERRRLDTLLAVERAYLEQGVTRIAGVDEAGMGPLAGPVVAAAVILPDGETIPGVDDSKRLSASARSILDREIRGRAVAIGIGVAEVDEVERLNVYQAGLLAMRRALDDLPVSPGMVLLDARRLPELPWPQEARVRADATIHSVACASILAKVHRDGLMCEFDLVYPKYGFARHKGYGTAAHRRALLEHGPCPIHRRSFLRSIEQMRLFDLQAPGRPDATTTNRPATDADRSIH